MATPTIASNTTFAFTAATNTFNIAKPAGLAVGDIMYMFFAQTNCVAATSFTAPASWSIFQTNQQSNNNFFSAWKRADAGDVAASNFTFSSDKPGITGGILCRLTNIVSGLELQTSDKDIGSSPGGATVFSFTSASSPLATNTLAIASYFVIELSAGATPTLSTYTATPSMSFTEAQEISYNSGSYTCTMSVAFANYTSTSQVTAYGFTSSRAINTGTGGFSGILALWNSDVSVSGSNNLLSVSPTLFTVNGVGGTTGTNTLLAVSPTINTQSGQSTIEPVWTNTTKPSDPTWTNTTKS